MYTYKIFKKFSSQNYFQLLILLTVFVSCKSDDGSLADIDEEIASEPIIENSLPVFAVSTNGIEIVDEPKIAANFTITDDEILYEGNMGI